MNKQKFKEQYSKVRRIYFYADQRAEGLPCGADDAVYDNAQRVVDNICVLYPAIEETLATRYDRDPLLDSDLNFRLSILRSVK